MGSVGGDACLLSWPPAHPLALLVWHSLWLSAPSSASSLLTTMSALPQVYASEEDLARSDSLRETHQLQEQFLAQTQQANGFGNYNGAPASPQATLNGYAAARSPTAAQQRQRTPPAQQQPQQQPLSPYDPRHVQRPQTGIASVPKWQQAHWQSLSAAGPREYNGSTFGHHLALHMPTAVATGGHADGPQHQQYPAGSTLPDAPHRQAWASQPTFRWFKRSDYDGVGDRWAEREGPSGRGDNTYRPLSVREQAEINLRVDRRKQLKGQPRTGEW